MEHIIKMDQSTKEQQDKLKQHLVNIIMNENTFIRNTEYVQSSKSCNAERKVTVDYLIADSIEVG